MRSISLAGGLLALAAIASAQTDPGIVYAVVGIQGSSPAISVSQNPSGQTVTVTRSGTGTYAVLFPGTVVQRWLVMADAHTTASNYCFATGNLPNTAEIDVDCYSASGAAADSPLTWLPAPFSASFRTRQHV